MVTVQYLRKTVSVFGLAFVFLLNSCATLPKLTQTKRSKQSLETQTKFVVDLAPAMSPKQIRDKIENQTLARSQLALPDRNNMKHLDSFTLKKGSVVFEGRIAPYTDRPGGARQMLIPGSLKNNLNFHSRIK